MKSSSCQSRVCRRLSAAPSFSRYRTTSDVTSMLRAKRGFSDGEAASTSTKAPADFNIDDVEPINAETEKKVGWNEETEQQDNTIYYIMAGSVVLVTAIVVGLGSATGVIDKSRWDKGLEGRTGYDVSTPGGAESAGQMVLGTLEAPKP